jgi:hypothetical protein
VALSADFELPSSRWTAPGAIATKATATTTAAPDRISAQRTLQRIAPSTASPTSRAVKLDCEKVTTIPPHSTTSSSAHTTTSRRRRAHSSHAVSSSITMARKRP